MKTVPALSSRLGALLQQFFVERLIQQKHASGCTVAAYRDSFRLLLAFAARRLHKQPADLQLADLSATLILAFLQHLEKERHNSIRSRNARFVAIRSFMQYVAYQEPTAVALAQSVLAIPLKRFERRLIGFLPKEQVEVILAAPDETRWAGQRDRVMLTTLYNTGARVSELIGMRIGDVSFEGVPAVRIHGKGRKERQVPLWRGTATQIRRWLRAYPREVDRPLFPNRSGAKLTRVGVTERLHLAVQRAALQFPELAQRRVSPHLLRHSLAMSLLQSGVDITVIALWLGHESVLTTHMYVEADLAMKERALKTLQIPKNKQIRYRPTDRLLGFLQAL
jgi:site-specific recombinase XerD